MRLKTLFVLFSGLGCLIAPSVDAEIFRCVFTEPFIVTTYSTSKSSLDIDATPNESHTVLRDISFQITAPNIFELWDANRRPIQRLKLNYEGSSGMNNDLYPYEVHWLTKDLKGGCTSNHLAMMPEKR